MGAPDKKEIAQMVVLNDLGKSARQIGAQTGHSPNTVLKYLQDSERLNDPKVKELVERYRDQEADHLALLGGKARALLEERLDAGKMSNIEAIALTDRFFQQRRAIEGKSTGNITHKVLLGFQREGIEAILAESRDVTPADEKSEQGDTHKEG